MPPPTTPVRSSLSSSLSGSSSSSSNLPPAPSSRRRAGVLLLVAALAVHALAALGIYARASFKMTAAAQQHAMRVAAASRRPDAFARCGDWQESYMKLHHKIVAGERPPRYLVAVVSQSGLADQVVGIMSLFFWALLTKRAFQITIGEQPMPPLEAAFDGPFINWTRPAGDPLVLTEHLYRPYGNGSLADRVYPLEHPDVEDLAGQYASMYLINQDNSFWSTHDLTRLPRKEARKPYLFMASNRGRVFRLFDNPYHRRALFEMGLRPETAFACAFRFLFAPNAKTRNETGWLLAKERLVLPDDDDVVDEAAAAAQEEEEAPLPIQQAAAVGRRLDDEATVLPPPPGIKARNESVLRIGIQIRVGDFVFSNPDKANQVQLEDYMPYFECAQQIQKHRRTQATKQVLWYLVSDSQRLKELAVDKFGAELLVTSTAAPSRHVICAKDTGRTDCGKEAREEMAGSLAAAAADMMGLAETDYIVLTRKSGFGKVAAWLNPRWHHVWWIPAVGEKGKKRADKEEGKEEGKEGDKPAVACGPKDYVHLETMADMWSGL